MAPGSRRGFLFRSCALAAVCILLLLGLVAQAGAQAAGSDVPAILDFADIQAGPVVLTPDSSGRSATLEVATTIPVACAVVFGTDGSFGSIATDQDMAGGAHSDHHPLLGGLEPDTAYVYRLQGSDAAGNLYVSKTFSFRTPPAPTGGAQNLALDATVVAVSSEFSEAFSGARATDGDSSTEWSSRGDGDDAWIVIDLGGVRKIDAVAFRTRSMTDGSSITETFSVTADGQEHGPFAAGDDPVAVDIQAQVLRLDVVASSGGNTGAVEIEVFGAEAAGE